MKPTSQEAKEANKLNDTVTQLRRHILMPRRRAARQTGITGCQDLGMWGMDGEQVLVAGAAE